MKTKQKPSKWKLSNHMNINEVLL